MNYFLDDRINNAKILFPGVCNFLIAVCLGSALHSFDAADNKAKLNNLSSYGKLELGITNTTVSREALLDKERKDLENGKRTEDKPKFGTANFLVELENKRSIKVFGKSTVIGLAIIFFPLLTIYQDRSMAPSQSIGRVLEMRSNKSNASHW